MKKILISKLPLILASTTLLIVTCFLRYNLYLNGQQLSQEFLTQNAQEIYSIDSLKITSRLNSLSKALNWVCIEASVNQISFFKLQQGECRTTIFKQKVDLHIPEANNLKISFTIKLPHNLEYLFIIFFLLQIGLILSLIIATQKSEQEKRQHEMKWLQLSRKMFHDIRSPLASLNTITQELSFASALEKELFTNSINRINDIANNLLSNTQQNAIMLPSFGPISNIVESIINEKRIEYPNCEIVFSNPLQSSNALMVESELKRILSNLINNAVEACDKKPFIEISIANSDHFEFITIKDNGKGIPVNILGRLGNEEITTKKAGNGIGFKEAADSLNEWGGKLEIIESHSNGTTIRISLQSKIEPKTYYLIDDDELVRLTWSSRARKKGIILKTFESVALFNQELKSIHKESNIFIDSELGDFKGEDLAQSLHAQGYSQLNMTSGHPPETFSKFTFLRSVISKAPPF